MRIVLRCLFFAAVAFAASPAFSQEVNPVDLLEQAGTLLPGGGGDDTARGWTPPSRSSCS